MADRGGNHLFCLLFHDHRYHHDGEDQQIRITQEIPPILMPEI
jgi:hypothetical protein